MVLMLASCGETHPKHWKMLNSLGVHVACWKMCHVSPPKFSDVVVIVVMACLTMELVGAYSNGSHVRV